MAEKELERIYVIPLQKIKQYTTTSRLAPRAIKEIKRFLVRHMKVEEEKIWVDNSVNENIWSRSKYKIPSRVRIRAIKFDDGVVEVSLPELELKESRREELKAVKETKKPILKKEEKKPSEEETKEEGKETKETETQEETSEEEGQKGDVETEVKKEPLKETKTKEEKTEEKQQSGTQKSEERFTEESSKEKNKTKVD
ncbi:MAG: 50S ribosomal protein L31e [Thermoplasmata archaeon]|nr:MAG: 50S ribosomal protein L31e [Thermoplasmata archaeon]